MKWYTVQVHSNYELKAKKDLLHRIQKLNVQDKFGEILIPIENVLSHDVKGRTRKRTKASYPGYMFVQMEMTDQTWHVVKNADKVITFIGNQKPNEVSLSQIEQIRKVMSGEVLKPRTKIKFSIGEKVKVITGAFENFSGVVQDICDDKQKLKVVVNIFGRETPVEIGFSEVAGLA